MRQNCSCACMKFSLIYLAALGTHCFTNLLPHACGLLAAGCTHKRGIFSNAFSMLQCPVNLLLQILLVVGIQRSQQTPMWVQARCPTRHRPSGVTQLPDDKRLLARKSRQRTPFLGETLGGVILESRKVIRAERLIAPRIFARGELAKTPD